MNFAERTIGDLVVENYRLASVFKQYGIDFCCGGGRTVQAACEKKGIPLDELQHALEAATKQTPKDEMRPDTWPPGLLVDYIVNIHHRYVRESIPLLQEFTRKVARVHGSDRSEVIEIARLFDEVATDLTQHMVKEEQVLFPYIKTLAAAHSGEQHLEHPGFGTVRNPIRMMEHEHEHAGAIMQEIRRLSHDFTPPEYACNTYRVSYAKLEEFENDLHRHVHLENNILFPRAAALEEELAAR